MDKNENAVAVFNKYAGIYQQKFMDVGLYADSLDWFCSQLIENASTLELACGPGNITRYLLDKRPDLKILGTDLAPNMVELAKTNNPKAVFEIMDCRKLQNNGQKYNAIMCGFCLPYLSKEEAAALICDASNLLLPKGILYLSTMEGDYSTSGLEAGSSGDLVFMHYHEHGYLAKMLLENGFKIHFTQRKQYPGRNGTVTDLILVSVKSQ